MEKNALKWMDIISQRMERKPNVPTVREPHGIE